MEEKNRELQVFDILETDTQRRNVEEFLDKKETMARARKDTTIRVLEELGATLIPVVITVILLSFGVKV